NQRPSSSESAPSSSRIQKLHLLWSQRDPMSSLESDDPIILYESRPHHHLESKRPLPQNKEAHHPQESSTPSFL
ncbi:hypothetical protein AVEN_13094-1, partial [Araneus ventricosus]